MTSKSAADARQPLPLPSMMAEHQKQNMREHLAAVQAIVAAIGRDDMDAVAKAAARIGCSEAMGQMCEHMGAAAPGCHATYRQQVVDEHSWKKLTAATPSR